MLEPGNFLDLPLAGQFLEAPFQLHRQDLLKFGDYICYLSLQLRHVCVCLLLQGAKQEQQLSAKNLLAVGTAAGPAVACRLRLAFVAFFSASRLSRSALSSAVTCRAGSLGIPSPVPPICSSAVQAKAYTPPMFGLQKLACLRITQ